MFKLSQPLALLLIPLAITIALLRWRKARSVIQWPGVSELVSIGERWPEFVSTFLWLIGIAAALAALAGPRLARTGAPIESHGMAIMLVVDVSGSMAELDVDWNGQSISRLEALKRWLSALIGQRPQDRIGLVLFSTLPDSTCPPTLDHDAVMQLLSAAQPRGIPTESETNIGDALAWAVARLQLEPGDKAIVLCSDGEHNVAGLALTPRQAAQLAIAAGVPTHAVDAGTAASPGRDSLDTLARMSGRRAVDIQNQAGLVHLNTELDELRKRRQLDPRRHNDQELYPWLALAAGCSITAALAYCRGPGRILP